MSKQELCFFGCEWIYEFSVVEEFPSDTPYKLLEAKETQLILEKQQKDVDLYNINVRMSLLV